MKCSKNKQSIKETKLDSEVFEKSLRNNIPDLLKEEKTVSLFKAYVYGFIWGITVTICIYEFIILNLKP